MAMINKKMILGLENEIASEFSTMMANDAMISIDLTPKNAMGLNSGDLESIFGDNTCQLISSSVNWQNEFQQKFIISEGDAKGLIAKINEFNDAIDSLDVLLENWNLAAQHNLSKGLDPAPIFSAPELENRMLNDSDISSDAIHIEYDIEIDDTKFHMSRVVAVEWQTVLEAANLDVTTVDDVNDFDDTELDVGKAAFSELTNGANRADGKDSDLTMLYDLKLDIVVELGRTKKPVQEILQLGRGAIVELEKLAGDPVEIYVNDKRLAFGEVVVVDDHFGVRITQLVKKSERPILDGE